MALGPQLAEEVAHWLDGAWTVLPLYDDDHAFVDVPETATLEQIAVLLAEAEANHCYYDHAGRQWRAPRGGDRIYLVRG